VDEILVVDNASTDGTEEMIKEKFSEKVNYVRLAENVGGSGGFNVGMRLGCEHGHDWIWCIDSDALPSEQTLEDLLRAESMSGSVVAKTSLFRDPVSYQQASLEGYLWYFRSRKEKAHLADNLSRRGVASADFGTLCCLLVRADALKKVGFVNPDFFIYGDEALLSIRLKRLGEILVVRTTVLHHFGQGGRSSRHGRSRVLREDYWRIYYHFRNYIVVEREAFGFSRAFTRSVWRYGRSLLGILLFDDSRGYRVGILSKALCDGVRNRLGKRILPDLPSA
jgi:GT2 family glycosyltransferase